MFTFSFGSAFAAAPTDAQAKLLGEAKAYAEGLVSANFDAAYKIATEKSLQYTPTSIASKDAWNADEVKAALQNLIDTKYVEAAKNFDSYTATTKQGLAAQLFTTGSDATISEYAPDGTTPTIASTQLAEVIFDLCEVKVTLDAFAADRADALSAFDKVDYSVYSDTEVDKASGKTYLALAQEKVAEGKANLSKREIYDAETFDPANLVNLTASMGIFKGGPNSYYTGGVAYYLTEKTIEVNGTPVGLGVYTVNGVKTKTALENEGITDAATAAQVKATAQKAYADYIVQDGADKEFAEAYVKVVSYLADAGEVKSLSTPDLSNTSIFTETVRNLYKDAVKNVAAMESFAAKYKAEKDSEGNLVRDGKAVDKLVEDYTTAEYKYAAGLPGATQPSKTTCESDIINKTILKTEEGLAFHKQVAKNQLADNKDAVIGDYYDLEAAKVLENYEKTLAKLEAADTVEKVHAVDITSATMTAGIKTADEVDAAVAYSAGTPAQKALEALDAYIAYTNSGKTVLDAGYIKATEAEKKEQINTIYGEAGARKTSELKGVAIDVATVAAKLPTVGAIATAKADAEGAIKALPASAKVADKDAVSAAFDLAEAYGDITEAANGTAADPENQSKLNTAITQLFADMQFDFAKKISAVDKTDKAALRALQAELDDANALIDAGALFEGKTPNFDAAGVIQDAIDKIRDKELAAVKAAINAIPVNVTEADKAVVEAARKAYDAFVEDWTVYSDCDDYYAAGEVDNFRELALAEAALGLNEEDPALSVAALKLTASSSAKKGSITVKWTVKGDTSAVEGYEIWKSTKENSGYKKAFTQKATKKTYKNTKGLKKGTRYFYKVRAIAYTADGTKVKSDWSNKARRIAK